MENTLDNKIAFFALYLNQDVLKHKYATSLYKLTAKNLYDCANFEYWDTWELVVLTPLHLISDEDAIEVAKLWTTETFYKAELFEDLQKLFEVATYRMPHTAADYLRSRGYALLWLNVNVEQQVEWGWVKLKTE
jgi:hypothetical protein